MSHSRIIRNPNTYTDLWDVLSEDFREVISSHHDFKDAVTALEAEVKKEKLACPTGGCDD